MELQPLKVLMVEDDEDDFVLVSNFLSLAPARFELEWAKTYEKGLDSIGSEKFDVCLLDYRLGRRSGIDFLKETSSLDCYSAPIIFLTGQGDYEVDMEAMRCGAADYLVKDQISADLLERSIRYAIERRRAEEDRKNYTDKLEQSYKELSETIAELKLAQERLHKRNAELQIIQDQLRFQNDELVSAREALEVERQRYIDLFTYAPEGYIVTNHSGRILETNRAAAELLAIPAELATSRALGDFVAAGDEQAFDEMLRRLRNLRGVRETEIHLQPWRGQPYPVEVSATTVLPRKSEGIALRWTIRDVSDRKESEESLRESEKQLRTLSSKLITAQEEERKRISSDLHDSIGSSLSAIKFGLESAIERTENGELREPLMGLVSMVQQVMDESRRIMTDLRPSMLDDLGVIATIGWFCSRYQSIYSKITIESVIKVDETDIPEPVKIVIFRVLQEALHNVSKYSKASLVKLTLKKQGDILELIVRDNGVGFDPGAVKGKSRLGLGLTTMKERTELSCGSFSIESMHGHGTNVRAFWRLSNT